MIHPTLVSWIGSLLPLLAMAVFYDRSSGSCAHCGNGDAHLYGTTLDQLASNQNCSQEKPSPAIPSGGQATSSVQVQTEY